MALFASLLASAVVATASATPLPWFDLNDYPTKAFAHEWQGVSSFEVVVDPSGKAVDCRITKSSGHELLDRQACWVPMKRARFTTAVDSDGRPTYGVYRSQVVWARPDRDRKSLQRDLGPDLEMSITQLPAGTSLAVKLAYFVDAQGTPSACAPMSDSSAVPTPIVEAACRALIGQLPHQPVLANGTAVAAVRTAAVKVDAAK